MRNGISPCFDFSTSLESHYFEKHELGSDANHCKHRQEYEASLQEPIERKTKEIKPHIDSKDRV